MSQTTDAGIAAALSQQFINENPREIVLVRRSRIATTAGGWKLRNPVNQLAQTMRFIPGRMYAETVRTTANGREVHPTFTLVGMIDVDVEQFDTFSLDEKSYEIVWVERRVMFGRTIGEVWQDA